MTDGQLPLFQRKTFKGVIPLLPIKIEAPVASMAVLHVLPAYYTYLKGGEFSKYTSDDFTGDVKKFGVFLKDRHIKDVTKRSRQ
jgi:hypothetical protein